MGNCTTKSEKSIRLLQWNILADGLGKDGFLSTEFVPIRESSAATAKKYKADEFMKLVRQAKVDDGNSGAVQAMNDLKKAEKRMKKLQPQDDEEKLKQQVASAKDTVSKSKLVNLKKQFERSPELERVDAEILDWNMRYHRIHALLLRANPDIITFQEIDHLKQFLDDGIFSSKYTCMLDFKSNYQIPVYHEDSSKDARRPENFMSELMRAKAAFFPKSYSNAYNFRKRDHPSGKDFDDDGVAVFWKTAKFEATELGFLEYPAKAGDSKRQGALAVTLRHKKSNQLINVLTAHLPSGDDVAKEQERLNVLRNPTSEFAAQRLCRQDNGAWKQIPYEVNQKFDGFLSFIQYYTPSKDTNQTKSRIIVALDTNSRPCFPLTDTSTTNGEKANVWNSFLQGTNLESIWVQSSILDLDGKPKNPKLPFVASVNKMRGPSSAQPSKIGEHQLELIDHIFTNAKNSQIVKEVQISEALRIPLAPLQYPAKEGPAEIQLKPTLTMPSDHLPVLVDIEL
ncbi:MAG: hypothetical protein SGBAC_005675 [Bacillariaceae sp.]